MEVVVEQTRREVLINKDDTMEGGMHARKRPHQYPSAIVSESSDNSTYLVKNGGAVEDLDIHNILSGVHVRDNGETKTTIDVIREERRGISQPIEEEKEILEEEVVELEFQKATTKLDTHTMHCPNCDHEIRKVVLRRKLIRRIPRVTEEPHKQLDLLGCFSCFSLFTATDNGRFNPFPIFWNKPASSALPQPNENEYISLPQARENENNGLENVEGGTYEPIYVLPRYDVRSRGQPYFGVEQPGQHDTSIIISPTTTTAVEGQTQGLVGSQDSKSFEILKSVVYGGLMEVIASLSIVASAAAGDATTLSIMALAIANLTGGIFVIGHNLWDLKDDCYKFSTQQTNNQQPRTKYKELLGSVEHFPMHVFFAILSFLMFGIIPPMAYGYSFYRTNDKDFTMLIVAVASLVSVGLLAIFKAYIDRCNGFAGYVKTVLYYLTTAVTVSGVSYVAGNLVMRFIKEVGWFETSSRVAMTNPSLAYY